MSMTHGATTSAPCVIFRLVFSGSTPRAELIEVSAEFPAKLPADLLAAECDHRQRWPKCWRRERDSNPRRAFDPYTLSRGAPSTTRPSLRLCLKAKGNQQLKLIEDPLCWQGRHDTEGLGPGKGARWPSVRRPRSARRSPPAPGAPRVPRDAP